MVVYIQTGILVALLLFTALTVRDIYHRLLQIEFEEQTAVGRQPWCRPGPPAGRRYWDARQFLCVC